MTEKDYQNDEGRSVDESRKKPGGTLILAVLLVFVALAVFIFVNSGISARTAGLTENGPGNPTSTGTGSCCSFGSPESEGTYSLAQGALDYYGKDGGNTAGIQAVVDDYGCHQEISLLREGELVKRYSYFGSDYVDITP